jgi:hypothetical protein
VDVIPGKIYGVVTGDVVGSTALTTLARRRLFDAMQEGSREVRKCFGDVVPLDVDVFSGDAWQLLVSDPHRSMRVALFYRAFLRAATGAGPRDRGVDSRLVVAIGPIDFLPSGRVSQGEGEAFQLSGRTLAGLRRVDGGMRLVAVDDVLSPPVLEAGDAMFRLVDAIVAHQWTAARSMAVTGALRGLNQEEISQLWSKPINQGSVAKHLDGASWYAVLHAIEWFERGVAAAIAHRA